LTADKKVRLDNAPVAYLLEPDECNSDVTNYWIFSPAGLRVLVKRAGWSILASANSGATESDPITQEGDERMFLLLQSNVV
jgi:tRNA (mo5U34)-methyltransferase